MIIEKLKSWPAAFDTLAKKINEIVIGIKPMMNIKASNGVKITISENDILIQGDGTGGGGGLPDGYGPEEWTVYDGGVVTTRNFLTDNPD